MRRTVGLGVAACGLTVTLAGARPAPDPDARLLDTLVELRLSTVLEEVLREPERDPMQRALYRVRMARAEVVDPAATPADRLARIDTLLTRSADLIAAHADHPLAAGWRLDRAEDAWRWLWPLEAAGVQVMLGIPDEAAIARADRVAAILVAEVPAAREALDATIEQLEFSAGWPDDPAVMREHRRLVEEEREGRLPILAAIEAAVRVLRPVEDAPASAGDDTDVDAIARIDEVLPRFAPPVGGGGPDDGAAARAMFLQLQGFVHLQGNDPDAAATVFAAARAAADVAGDAFGADVAAIAGEIALARSPRRDASTAARERLAARAGGTIPFTSPATDFLRVLSADAAFRAGATIARRGRGPESVARDAWATGISGWTGLAERDRRWFALMRERFARSLQDGDPVKDLPAVGRLGWSDALEAGGQPEAAMAVLAQVASDGNAPDTVRSEAWRAIGRSAAASGRVRIAARATLAAAIIEPDDDRAQGLVDAALRLAASGDGVASTSEADFAWPDAANPAIESDPLLAALAHAEARHPALPELDRWRTITAGRLATGGRTAEAERILGRVSPDADEAAAALATGLALARTRLREAVTGSAPAATIAASATTLLERLEDARRLVAGGGDSDARLASRLAQGRGGVLEAEAHLATARPRRALRSLGLLDGSAGEPGPASVDSEDESVRAAAADLAVRCLLDLLPAASASAPVPDSGASSADDAAALAAAVARVAIASPRAARALVAELDRRVERAEDAASPTGPYPAPGGADAAGLRPLVDGLTAWLRAPAETGGGDPDADRALRAVAFREIGRAELVAGRPARAEAWFAALGGIEASDPAVLLGAAEVRFRRATSEAGSGEDVEQTLAAAMGAYRRLAANRAAAGDRRWWLAQLRMLQILDRTGRGASTIGPRLRRLALTEPELGGPRFRPGFEALAERFPAQP